MKSIALSAHILNTISGCLKHVRVAEAQLCRAALPIRPLRRKQKSVPEWKTGQWNDQPLPRASNNSPAAIHSQCIARA